MNTKIGIIFSVLVIYATVSAWFGHVYKSVLSLSTSDSIGQPTYNFVSWGTSSMSFFLKMFTFSVPNMPDVFSILWWILGIMLAIAVYLLIREG